MPRIIRQYDPDETSRRIAIEIREDICPGMLEFLAHLPYRHETPFIRAVIYQWFLAYQESGQLEQAVTAILQGPGGISPNRPPQVAELTALKSFIQGQAKKPAKRRTAKSSEK